VTAFPGDFPATAFSASVVSSVKITAPLMVPLERHHQRREQFFRAQRPVAQRLARDLRAVPGEHALRARRAVVGVFGDRHMGQQPGARVTAQQR
jgi:hypothetical protein